MLTITFHNCRTEGLRLYPRGMGRLAQGRLDILSDGPPIHRNDVLRIFDYLAITPESPESVDLTALRTVPPSGVEWRASVDTPESFENDYRGTIDTLKIPAIEQPARMWAEHHGFIWTYKTLAGTRAYEVRFNASHVDVEASLERAFAHTANSASQFGVTVEICREQLDWLISKRQAAVSVVR
jgi:hypothetical protein